MNRTHLTLALGALVAIVALSGCSDDSASTPSVTTVSCDSTEACQADAPGNVCVGGECRACVDDTSCAEDAFFGAGASCDAATGMCATCVGQDGCGCAEGDSCEGDLVCMGGTCQACPDGSESCACYTNGTCDEGLRCDDAGESCEACPAGAEGCACGEGDACDGELECMEGNCAQPTCTAGALDCPCDADDACDEGLTCTEGGMCAECTPEFEGCPCDEDGNCESDLVCDEDDETCRAAQECADLGCVDNQVCEESTGGVDAACLEECMPGFDYNADTGMCDEVITANCDEGADGSILADCTALGRTCAATDSGASCDACLTGFVQDEDDAESCRAVLTCDDLSCGDDNRACTDATDAADASCGDCVEGFMEDMGSCVEIPVANCLADDPDSILATCDAQNRACVADADAGTAACLDCKAGFTEDADNMCVPEVFCADLDCEGTYGRQCDGEPLAACGDCVEGTMEDPDMVVDGVTVCREALTCDDLTCPDDEFCIEGDGTTDAECLAWPCLDANGDPDTTRAFREDTATCVACQTCQANDGQTGDLWPFTEQNSDRCYCETRSGYFIDTGGVLDADPCDADGDGWVRDDARSAIESTDPALAANARCDLRVVDRFVLKNEWGQTREVQICVEGDDPRYKPLEDGACAEPDPVELYESVRNDDATNVEALPEFTNDAQGRRFRAEELNGLTKACVTETADFNDDKATDVSQYHGITPSDELIDEGAPERLVFLDFAFFVELHRNYYEKDLGADYGNYVIEERSRCESDFPIQYAAGVDAGDWWAQCTRNRDTDFDITAPDEKFNVGMDFGQYSCDANLGACPVPLPVTEMSSDTEVPPHGLCELATPLDEAEPWRGMNHHSQFKCAVIDSSAPQFPQQDRQVYTASELADSFGDGTYQFNRCSVDCPDDDLDCAADCTDGACLTSYTDAESFGVDATNPAVTSITCEPIDRANVTVDDVGFVAIRYDAASGYTRGCVNEWSPSTTLTEIAAWRGICPGYPDTTDPTIPEAQSIVGQGNTGNFGKITCGCGTNFGGDGCAAGCPDQMVHFGGTFTDVADCAGNNGYCASYAPTASEEAMGVTGGRKGFWMCADFSSTAYVEGDAALGQISSGGEDCDSPPCFQIKGEVPKVGFTNQPLCENPDDDGNCGSGWAVR